MPLPCTFLRAALASSLTLSACVADDANLVPTDPAAVDEEESTDGTLLLDADNPDPNVDPFLDALDRVEFSSDDSRIELLAYDADDQLIGTLALHYHEDGTVQLAADFDDGAALVEIHGGSVTQRYSGLLDSVIARRAEAVGLALDSGPQAGWWKCAGMVALTIHNCWNPATALWACGISSFLAACECLDYLGDKYGWVHDEC